MQKLFLNQIQSVELGDESYPELLKKIPGMPSTLYFRGKLLANEACFAIVGTRRCSDYGKEIAFSFAKELSKAGITIVSGMARGIDTFAHKGALSVNGRTIAVFGTGLNEEVIYPKENIGLAKDIVSKGGCLISEYSHEIRGSKFTFPQRNRIVSGLSLGVLVVEAKFGSGSLITARIAQKQNKKIFAIPGSIYSLNSKGTNDLIKNGSLLVEKPNDILKALGMQRLDLPTQSPTSNPSQQIEQLIVDTLQNGGLHIDKIIEQTKLSSGEVSGILSLMEIESKIKNLGGNVYALI